jgi:hypothetical protein
MQNNPYQNSDGSDTQLGQYYKMFKDNSLNPVQRTDFERLSRQAGLNPGEGYNDYLSRNQTEANMNAVKPAVDSLSAGIPELRQAYTQRQTQVQAEKEPLVQRYEQLLNEIRGRETSQVNEVTRNTNREMARRGISGDSTFASDELQGRTAPIRGAAQSDILTTSFDRESKLREIDNMITNLNSEMVQAERDIRNSIAQIQAQAGSAGVAQALQIFQMAQQQREAALDRALQERQLTANIDNARLTSNSAAFKEVQGGLFNTQTNQWVVPPKATGGSGTGNAASYLTKTVNNTGTTQNKNSTGKWFITG